MTIEPDYKIVNNASTTCPHTLDIFLSLLNEMNDVSILELGAKNQGGEHASKLHKKEWFNGDNIKEIITSDIENGEEIDQVADIHDLTSVFGKDRFDVVSCSVTLEHVKYPWIAAEEISKVTKIGGLVYIIVPHTFVTHAYPDDYWRFTDHALEILFGPQTGFEVIQSSYMFQCYIHSEQNKQQKDLTTAFLLSSIVSRKVKHVDKVIWFQKE